MRADATTTTTFQNSKAELSDNGKAPEPLTYQKATELARRLRTPAKP